MDNKISKSFIDKDSQEVALLSSIKPAGTKIILMPNKSSLLDLMKLTVFDLAIKQVIKIRIRLRKSHPRDPHLRKYIVVETGKNFKKYEPDTFEKYFISMLVEDRYFLLRGYLQKIYKEISSTYSFKREIIENLKLQNVFSKNVFLYIFRFLKVNKKSRKLQKDIEEFLNKIDRNIGDLIENEPKKMLELLMFLKGNVFLLKNIKFELFEKLKSVKIKNTSQEFVDDYFLIDVFDNSDLFFSDVFSDAVNIFDNFDDYVIFQPGGGDVDIFDASDFF